MNNIDFKKAEMFINNTSRRFEKEVSNALLYGHSRDNALVTEIAYRL